jgi:cytochrome c-type biogenesis protein CcmH/NrfG
MSEARNTTWSSQQAYALAIVCLLLGTAGGWLFRGSQSPAAANVPANAAGTPSMNSIETSRPSPDQLKKMADTQAAPFIEKLKNSPNDPELLAKIGNIYYDIQAYSTAIDYYQLALQARPRDASVRTDMATAFWYLGNADTAIKEFNKALTYEPNKANTLFNLGMVQWQGKMDIKAAVASWHKLLATNPNYENKDKVLQLIAQAEKHSSVKPGTQAKPLPN